MSETGYFVSDLHGQTQRYRSLWQLVLARPPGALFLGGDLLPSGLDSGDPNPEAGADFVTRELAPGCRRLRAELGPAYPAVFVILGNDDARATEGSLAEGEAEGLWIHLHARSAPWATRVVYGYACIPPTPFLFKDWERYDVGRHLPPGAVSPEEGFRSVPVEAQTIRWATILEDLNELAGPDPLSEAVFLFHAPPHGTRLDRAALDGKRVDHTPLDVHVGSVAIRRFIEARRPRLTLHGHVHESARLTGSWRDRLGETHLFSAAHDGPELAVVRFRMDDLEGADRILV